MADIRINDLPLESSPSPSEFLAIDGASTRKSDIQTVVNVAVPVASQAEAEAGSNASKRMTPLTTKQSIASEVGVTLASAAQGALAGSALQPSDLSSTVTVGKGVLVANAFGLATVYVPDGLFLFQQEGTTTGADVHSVRVDRRADYAGGVDGFENAAFYVNNVVDSKVKSSYETVGLFQLSNSAPYNAGINGGGPQNTALRIRALRKNTGPTWGEAHETADETQMLITPAVSPTTPLIARESVIAANGPDNNVQRIGNDIIACRPYNDAAGHTLAGDPATIGVGLRISRSAGDSTTDNRFERGIRLGASSAFKTNFGAGIDMTGATFIGAALWLGDGAPIAWDTGGVFTTTVSGGILSTKSGAVDAFKHDTNGNAGFGPNAFSQIAGNTQVRVQVASGQSLFEAQAGSLSARVAANAGLGGIVIGSSSAHPALLVYNGAEQVRLTANGMTANNPIGLKSYTVATLPAPGLMTGGIIYVSNLTGGAESCYSDGTNWRRSSDKTVAN